MQCFAIVAEYEFKRAVKMVNLKEARWQQRFQNFEKAFTQLKSAVDLYPDLSDLEKKGPIQRFQYL